MLWNNNNIKSDMTFTDLKDTSYIIENRNGNFEIFFVYDDKGLFRLGVKERDEQRNYMNKLSLYLNFDDYENKRVLRSYQYNDYNYNITTNLFEENDSYLIGRSEYYKNIGKTFYLYKNKEVEINDFEYKK
jgi:hypothetical protein